MSLQSLIGPVQKFVEQDIGEYEGFLEIDQYALDKMLMEHPVRFQIIAEQFAHAFSYRDAMDKVLKENYAILYSDIKEQALVSGIKMTEAALKESVVSNPSYSKLVKLSMEISHRSEILRALKDSMTSRGFMLRDLASLYIAGYFAKDSVSGIASDEVKTDVAKRSIRRKKFTSD